MRSRTIKKSFYLSEEENRLLKEKCFGGFIAPKIKQLNADIQNCYKIEKRTILWQQEYDKAMEKEQEQQKNNELKQCKKKSRKYLK